MKRTIILRESELKRMISESVKKALNEIKLVDKIPNFDRNKSYGKYKGKWMGYKEAEEAYWKDMRNRRDAEKRLSKQSNKSFGADKDFQYLRKIEPIINEISDKCSLREYNIGLDASIQNGRLVFQIDNSAIFIDSDDYDCSYEEFLDLVMAVTKELQLKGFEINAKPEFKIDGNDFFAFISTPIY